MERTRRAPSKLGTPKRIEQRGEGAPPRTRGGRVTSLEPQVKHPDRINLFVDNHFALGLSASVAAPVRVGQELSTPELEELARAEQLEEAHERALVRLEVRPRSEAEIRRYLLGRKYPDGVVTQVIDRLKAARLVSDREFVKFWVENREEFRPRSARALKYELRQKGVPKEEITRVVSKLDEADSAYRAARPRATRWQDLDAQAFREKLSGFLARRGFGYQVTRDTVTRIWKELKGQDWSNEESEEIWDPS
jgi:regulatory protein